MQTLCERLQDAGTICASFFFKRVLFVTLAYQLAICQDDLKALISRNVETDPSVLGRGMDVQLRTLILEPRNLLQNDALLVLLIDGSDECEGRNIQQEILRLIQSTADEQFCRLRILVASRPEAHIKETFEAQFFQRVTHTTNIQQSFEDIRTYLCDEFLRIHREHSTMKNISTPWPSPQILEILVERSSGYFVYAATVIKFVGDEYSWPSKQLDIVVQNLIPHGSESPFATLDQLYMQILSRIPVRYHPTLCDILCVKIHYPQNFTMQDIDALLGLELGTVELIICPLHSVLEVPALSRESLGVHHASFLDFLKDEARSSCFYVGSEEYKSKLGHSILRALSYTYDDPQKNLANFDLYRLKRTEWRPFSSTKNLACGYCKELSMRLLQIQQTSFRHLFPLHRRTLSADQSRGLTSHASPALDEAFEGILTAPSSPETSLLISRIWDQFDHIRLSEATAALTLKLQRQSVMVTTYCAWGWLDSYCTMVITKALEEPIAESWIGRLAKHVHTPLSTRADSRELRPADYGLDTLEATYQYRRRASLDLDIPASQVITLVLDIIARWLKFPVNSKSWAQAWFVDAMYHCCSSSTLFLDSVWYAFGHLETEIFGDSKAKILSPAAFDPLRHALRRCRLSDPSSQESLRLLLDASDSREMRLMKRFLDALLQLEPLIDGYENIANPTLFQATVHGKADFLLPFREHGPSRSRSRLPGNSFDPLHSRTRGGLFSGLIFRGVIFATPFSMQANTYFEDPDAWRSEYAKFPNHESSFFCNLAAYSRAKSHRGIHLADEYWNALSMAGCPDWEANTRNGAYAFTDCFRFLKAGNPSRFREIGPFIAFLLAAHVHYAGAVCAPSVSVVGAIVHEINKGGVLGLEQLGLVSPRKLGWEQRAGPRRVILKISRLVFSHLFRFLDAKLSSGSKEHMCFDAIMVDNSLCKWTRWIKLKLISLLL
ncbi:hypothetical protein B0H14DRAFT_3147086 [Mycena olivaceomarginata]|nr:hypothetical protein B0H14DRAFT_3147086 [Mycena olivaceomarginata]